MLKWKRSHWHELHDHTVSSSRFASAECEFELEHFKGRQLKLATLWLTTNARLATSVNFIVRAALAQGKVSSSQHWVLIHDPNVISNHSRHNKPHQNAQCWFKPFHPGIVDQNPTRECETFPCVGTSPLLLIEFKKYWKNNFQRLTCSRSGSCSDSHSGSPRLQVFWPLQGYGRRDKCNCMVPERPHCYGQNVRFLW